MEMKGQDGVGGEGGKQRYGDVDWAPRKSSRQRLGRHVMAFMRVGCEVEAVVIKSDKRAWTKIVEEIGRMRAAIGKQREDDPERAGTGEDNKE